MKRILLFLILFICIPAIAQRFMEEVPTIAALKTRLPGSINKSVFVRGYWVEGDGGGGEFVITNSIIGVDNGLKVQSTAGPTFSYLRKVDGAVSPKWFGAKGDGITDDTARLQEAITQSTSRGYPIYLGGAVNYAVVSSINLPDNCTIYGSGDASSISGQATVITLSLSSRTNVNLREFKLGGTSSLQVKINGCSNIRLDNLLITGAILSSGGYTAGIEIEGGSNITLDHIRCVGNGQTAFVNNLDYNIVSGFANLVTTNLVIVNPTIINGTSKFGIALFNPIDAKIQGGYIDMAGQGTIDADGYGVVVYGKSGIATALRPSITGGLIVTNTWGTGILYRNVDGGEIIGAQFSKVAQGASDFSIGQGAISLTKAKDVRLVSIGITNSGINSGISIDSSTNVSISGGSISLPGTNHWGIELRGENLSTSIKGVTVENAHRGIGTTIGNGVCQAVDIEGCFIRNVVDGMFLSAASSNNVIRANRIFNNSGSGITDAGTYTLLSDNVIIGGIIGIYAIGTNGIIAVNEIQGQTTGLNVIGSGYRVDPLGRYHDNTTPITDAGGALLKTLTSGVFPSVKDSPGYTFNYAAPTTITNFADGLPGMMRTFFTLNSNVTIKHGTPINLDGAGDFNMQPGDSLLIEKDITGGWKQIGKSINSSWLYINRATGLITITAPVVHIGNLQQVATPSAVTYANELVLLNNATANARLVHWYASGNVDGFSLETTPDGTNYLIGLNGVKYQFPYVQGPPGSVWVNDGTGILSSQLPGSIFGFSDQFTINLNTNISIADGASITNADLAGGVTVSTLSLGAVSGAINVDADIANEINLLLTGNATITFTNFSDRHNLNVEMTNNGNFSLTFTPSYNMYWMPTGNSTQSTNDWGAGIINTFSFWKAGGRVRARRDGLGSNGATGANPSASVGLAAINGSAATFLRSDGAPALNQAIAPTWTGSHLYSQSANGEIDFITLRNTDVTASLNAADQIRFQLSDDAGNVSDAGFIRASKRNDWSSLAVANSSIVISAVNSNTFGSFFTVGNGFLSFIPGYASGTGDPVVNGTVFTLGTQAQAATNAQQNSAGLSFAGNAWSGASGGVSLQQVMNIYNAPEGVAANSPIGRLRFTGTNPTGGTETFAEINGNNYLKTLGGRLIARFSTATNYTLTATNHYVAVIATCTNTLPPVSTALDGRVYIIKNVAGTTTVRPSGADTIDGVAGDDVLTSNSSHTYISDGISNWELN